MTFICTTLFMCTYKHLNATSKRTRNTLSNQIIVHIYEYQKRIGKHNINIVRAKNISKFHLAINK